ncbi:transglutaminase domain-containing protein [Paenibacillus abyssi]|uniref:Transglutaminase-like domain-containing protein n=1 Tax=Paenibacillus abyssi TaxID=1340531 RepID=A0A917FRP5_9BACL|nr:transglutaminase-like domain-containing protein [Paenibacillus abyssi]GGF96728.1 hypothetical protein GCM10010916_12480 [Paenibacillus abyssi]
MTDWIKAFTVVEPVSVLILLLLIGSLIQGMMRGASGSARRLFYFIWDGLLIIVSLVLAGRMASVLSPLLQSWLIERNVTVPQEQLNTFSQLWYTFVTGLRDFSLLRFGVVFLVVYMLLRLLLSLLTPLVYLLLNGLSGMRRLWGGSGDQPSWLHAVTSRVTGATIGAVHGIGRALVVMAVLFIYVSLLPSGPFVSSIQSSPVYKEAAVKLIEPVAGNMIAEQGPVLTEAVESEFRLILQRKYEIIDYAVPAEIEQAAAHITKDLQSDEDKARALYDWAGTRIAYDWDKARNYEERGIWKEQTPEETFATRKGVCIDVARLYAMMARSVGLEVKVVTGLGADGRGGYGPHAWNEVLLSETRQWIPLDATWASSGDWFNPPDFDATHIPESEI